MNRHCGPDVRIFTNVFLERISVCLNIKSSKLRLKWTTILDFSMIIYYIIEKSIYFNTTLIRQWSLFGSVFIYKWFMPNFSKIINIIFANLLNKELFHRTVHESLLLCTLVKIRWQYFEKKNSKIIIFIFRYDTKRLVSRNAIPYSRSSRYVQSTI